MDFNALIETHNNFPKEGIQYKDVLPILRSPENFSNLIKKMSNFDFFKNADSILAIDARGFIFGSAIALQASKPMIVARKPGKLPGILCKKNYSLEYGEGSLSIQEKALQKYNSYAIVDDLLATGGTVNCVSKMLQDYQKKVVGLLVVVELTKLKGKNNFNFPVESYVEL